MDGLIQRRGVGWRGTSGGRSRPWRWPASGWPWPRCWPPAARWSRPSWPRGRPATGRGGGAAGGWSAAPAPRGRPAPWPPGLFGARSWLAGYLAGVLVAEYRWARPRTGVVRSAALVPPRLGDSLPARVVAEMRLAALATVALVPLLAWGPLAAPVPVRGLVVGGRGGWGGAPRAAPPRA